MKYVIYATVSSLAERFRPLYKSGIGKDATFEEASQGWFVRLRGSNEALYLGVEKPPFNKGDLIKISLEKVEDGQS